MPESNNWGISYSSISFVERALRSHTKVAVFKRTKDILFDIKLTNGKSIKMVLVDEYTLGLAAIHRILDEFPDVEYIVTCANWNGYTREAKDYGRENDLGVFVVGEFFGALYRTEPKAYYQKDKDGKPVYYYRAS